MSSLQTNNVQFRIPKIKKLDTTIIDPIPTPIPTIISSIENNYPKITISQLDMFRIFAHLTILFIGDNSIRTFYRDFVNLFSNGRLLKDSEISIQNGEYKEMKCERRLQKGGKLGSSEYKDIRQYFCEASSTRLIYIYIPTVFGNIAEKNINYLKTMKDCTSIHVVLFSLYHGDLNFAKLKKLKKLKKPLKQHLEEYDENLNNVCMHLLDICSNKKDVHQQKIWLSPYPPNMKLSNVEEKILNKIIRHTNKITGANGFKTFNRNYIWDKIHDDLLIKGSHYFSSQGIRLITQFFAEIVGKKWHRTMPK